MPAIVYPQLTDLKILTEIKAESIRVQDRLEEIEKLLILSNETQQEAFDIDIAE